MIKMIFVIKRRDGKKARRKFLKLFGELLDNSSR